MIPKQVLEYIKNKKLKTAFSYRDVWNEEHANNFTVAKAMQMDVLSDLKQAVEQAIENGKSFASFKKNIASTLQEKGWWGKKEMIDPVTRETVNAQLGSDRRLKTIYDTNLRSSYQQGRWERSQASGTHPYLLYRVGNSKTHRKEHLAWDGILLHKDDPWWNGRFPPNGYGCKCFTQAISEARKQELEKTGIKTPPSHDGTPGRNIQIKTQAPPARYTTYVDKRTGRIEKIPVGVTPGFNWNPGRMGREVPLFESFMKKGANGFHKNIEEVARTILTNQIKRDEFSSFVNRAYKGELNGQYATAAGFIDSKVASFLKKQTGTEPGDNVTIALEARLLNGPKAARHAAAGNAVDKEAAGHLIDSLLYGQVYYDEGNLIYVGFNSDKSYTKVTVAPVKKLATSEGSVSTPTVVNIQTIGATADDGEYRRITETLERIK